MKSVICLLGSPRADGNSKQLVDAFCDSLDSSRINLKRYQLSDLDYNGCKNLFACKTSLNHCGQQDDLTQVLAEIIHADVVVLSSPIFFTDVSGQLKSCLDRWFSFFVPDYATAEVKSRLVSGKTMVFIQTQGEDESRYSDILEKYNHSFSWLGFTQSHLIRASGVRTAGDILEYPEVIEEARQLGKQICHQLAE